MTIHALIAYLSSIQPTELPGERAHKDLIPANRPLNSNIPDTSGYRESAVAIFLFEAQGVVKSLLIERPEYDGHHSKQIAFPGGKKDETDSDLEFTARRESWEEIGIPANSGKFINKLTPVHIPVSRFSVHPYVFHLTEPPSIIPDAREVQRVIEFSPMELLSDANIHLVDVRSTTGARFKQIPAFKLDENTVIWGATAMILAELKHVLSQMPD